MSSCPLSSRSRGPGSISERWVVPSGAVTVWASKSIVTSARAGGTVAITLRANTYLRPFILDFIRTTESHLTPTVVREALRNTSQQARQISGPPMRRPHFSRN